jgi:hypothetical protein
MAMGGHDMGAATVRERYGGGHDVGSAAAEIQRPRAADGGGGPGSGASVSFFYFLENVCRALEYGAQQSKTRAVNLVSPSVNFFCHAP